MNLPVLQAILVADQAYQDTNTGKFIICGIFSKVFLIPGVPSTADEKVQQSVAATYQRAGSPFAYLSLTEVHGTRPLELRFVDLADNSLVIKIDFQLTSANPLDNLEIAIPLPELQMVHDGAFALELYSNDSWLESHRILATFTEMKQ